MITALFDTETTGLIDNRVMQDVHQPRVIEFYGMKIDDRGTKIAELEFRCNPGRPIPAIVTKVTGIKDADVAGCFPFLAHMKSVREFFAEADLVVAHNLKFDLQMINMEFERNGSAIEWPSRLLCTIEETEYLAGTRMKLGDLHEHLFGEKFADAHSARADVEALARCFLDLKSKGLI